MKRQTRSSMTPREGRGYFTKWASLSVVCVLGIVSIIASAPNIPEPRTGPEFDGSAKWAYNLAQPLIADFSSDAELYVIAGARIDTGGRLFMNTGSWGFMTWSASRQERFQVTVSYNGTTKIKREDNSEPPGRGEPMPAGWANSTVIFQAAWPYVNDVPKEVSIVIVNWADYAEAPGEAVWGLSYSSPGGTHKVRWDGVYLQPQ